MQYGELKGSPRRDQLRAPLLVCLSLLAQAIGCGSETPSAVKGPCEELQPQCLIDQMTCVAEGDTARCEACPAGQYAVEAGGCEPIAGTQYQHEFAEFTVQSGEEIKGLCQSWTLNNAEEIWVNTVELDQDEKSHHSIWTYVPDNMFNGPDGVWNCADRGYNELLGAISGGVLFAQSTQAEHEVQKFPNAAAVRIPPYSRIIGDIHLLNTTPEPVTGNVRLTIYGLPESDVKVKLVPFELTYRDIRVPARSQTRLFASCELDSDFQAAGNIPFGLDLYYILPHTHERGTRVFLDILGGPSDGERVFDITGYNGEARGRAFNTPVTIAGATGFTFGCEYDNTTDTDFVWGFNEEMCQMLGFAGMPIAFSTTIETSEQIEPDGDMNQFTGPCSTIALPWNFDKAGGPGPMP